MEHITIGQVNGWVVLIVGLIAGGKVLYNSLKTLITKLLDDNFSDINNRIKDLSDKIDIVDLESTKNFLVARLSEVEQGKAFDEIEKERFYEQFEHYENQGGNSYIKNKIDNLREEGKI